MVHEMTCNECLMKRCINIFAQCGTWARDAWHKLHDNVDVSLGAERSNTHGIAAAKDGR